MVEHLSVTNGIVIKQTALVQAFYLLTWDSTLDKHRRVSIERICLGVITYLFYI